MPNSACTAGSATTNDHMPTLPMVPSTSATASLIQAYVEATAPLSAWLAFLMVTILSRRYRPAIASGGRDFPASRLRTWQNRVAHADVNSGGVQHFNGCVPDDGIASAALGAIERCVGGFDQNLRLQARAGAQRCHADTDRHVSAGGR